MEFSKQWRDGIENIVSKALNDAEISHEEFPQVSNEEEN